MSIKINFNGKIQEGAEISALDHGFLFGDSVYEVVCTFNNQLCFADKHLKRLRNSASGIQLKVPYSDERFMREIVRTVAVAENEESYVRIVVTRGVGEIDIDPSSCERPNVLIYVTPVKPYPSTYYEDGIDVALVTVKRNAREALNPGIKTGNYLNNVLAKMEANRLGAKDALMLNPWGYLTECTTSNFFFARDGVLMTPSLDCGILAGITREIVIQLARENGFVVEEGQWPQEELEKADEAFVTGTVKRVLPVTQLDNRPIGDGKPGPMTRKLMRLYEGLLQGLHGKVEQLQK
ncbi:MAG: aminotransferase class IV [Nitrospinae bacterium]|nr:aminotransferase class IV [Nitrospinota bacterium]